MRAADAVGARRTARPAPGEDGRRGDPRDANQADGPIGAPGPDVVDVPDGAATGDPDRDPLVRRRPGVTALLQRAALALGHLLTAPRTRRGAVRHALV